MPTLARASPDRELERLIRLYLRAETDIINEIGRLRSQGLVDYHAVAALERVQAILRQLETQDWEYVPRLVEAQFYVRRPDARAVPGETVEKHRAGYLNAKTLTSTQTDIVQRLTMNLMGQLTAISAALSATVFGILMGLIVAAAAVALGVAIAAIVGSMGGSKKNVSHGGGSSGGGSSGSGSMGSVDITTGTGSLEDAINANTKALEKTNSALADMIRQAGALVLSDNMRLGSTVAASGTAQVVSAANSYHREGDTNITQNFYNGHDTAAAQQREARWEADKAKARKR